MLVLVSFGLVLLATILLVVGLLADDGLTLIYLSIAASFVAAIVLYTAFRRARPTSDPALVAPTPIPPEGAAPEDLEPATVTPAVAPTTTAEAVAAAAEDPAAVEPEAAWEAEPEPDTELATVPVAGDDDWTTDDDWADDGEFDVEFPIADYDELNVAEIMPLLPQLYSDELGIVAERERNGQNRSSILARLDELAASGTDADALEAAMAPSDEAEPAAVPASPPPPAPVPRDETLAMPRPAPPAPQVPSLSDDDEDDGVVFPIADYDELSVDQIVPLLAQLEDDELEDVKSREIAGQGRKTVISEIDRQLGLVDAGVDRDDEGWAEPPPTAAPAPATAPAPEGRPAPQAEAPAGSVLAIAGYDGLTVAQIRPALNGLSASELRAVLDHEVARDNRRTIVAEIERRLAAAPEPAPGPEPAPARAARSATTSTKKAGAKRAAVKQATAKKATAKKAPAARKAGVAKKSARATKKAATPRFPIADYDTLTVAQVRPRLAGLTAAQLRQVQAREERGAGRKTILNDIASRLG